MNFDVLLPILAREVAPAPDEPLDRLYVFDPVERGDTAFSLVFAVKRLNGGRLEMIAIGDRAVQGALQEPDFVRRARFPASVLPRILAEFIDRCGGDGTASREIRLKGEGSAGEQLAELASRLGAGQTEPGGG